MTIYINQTDENAVWVTSDEDAVGVELSFDPETDENERCMIALAEFLGYSPQDVLCFDSLDGGITWTDMPTGEVEQETPRIGSKSFVESLVSDVEACPGVAEVETCGPFGLRAYSSLFAKNKDGETIGWLTVESKDDGWLYETGRTNGRKCDPDSLAALNGFDRETKPLPEDKDEIIKLVFDKGEEV